MNENEMVAAPAIERNEELTVAQRWASVVLIYPDDTPVSSVHDGLEAMQAMLKQEPRGIQIHSWEVH